MSSIGLVLPKNAASMAGWGARSLRERSGIHSLDQSASLDERAHQIERQGVAKVLLDLNEEFGFDWGQIARVGGVSRAGLRKWREDQAAPRRDRWQRLLSLAALCEWLAARGANARGWLESPLHESGRVSGLCLLDVAAVGHAKVLPHFFLNRITEREVLERAFPGREVRPRWFHPVVAFEQGAAVIALPELDLVSSGTDLPSAEADMIEMVIDYLRDWDSSLKSYSPHKERAEIIEGLRGLDGAGLRRRIFGK